MSRSKMRRQTAVPPSGFLLSATQAVACDEVASSSAARGRRQVAALLIHYEVLSDLSRNNNGI